MSLLLPLGYEGMGGFLGAVLHFLMSVSTQKVSLSFPVSTLAANLLLGCFAIGIFMGLVARTDLNSTEGRLLFATGLFGGYTTLSSMVYELAELFREGVRLLAAAYFTATFVGALLSFYAWSLPVTPLVGSLRVRSRKFRARPSCCGSFSEKPTRSGTFRFTKSSSRMPGWSAPSSGAGFSPSAGRVGSTRRSSGSVGRPPDRHRDCGRGGQDRGLRRASQSTLRRGAVQGLITKEKVEIIQYIHKTETGNA